ncbi:MAG: competence protein ComEA [Solirubrobacteraceae bacterium]|jgi:competence protein ComEA|nr:competence protein ComEA [Solirubrobacteraceae bacterium]
MGEMGRRQLGVYALAAVVVVLLAARYLRDSGPAGRSGGVPAPVPVRVAGGGAADASGWAVVQVAGEVRSPGVYRLRTGKRADDAVRMAGGPTARAELSGVNLAAKVEDGRQVIVPRRAGAGSSTSPAGDVASGGAASAGAGGGGAASGGPAPGAPLNLNTASAQQLDQLDGVGPATAQKIVAYRQAHNGFRSVNELDQVPGIGPKRLATLKPLLTV